ncbi:hypothetical protein BV898_00218 [Hypsibius exemplaris]|uniref:Uncharacterized protein n=1 Tax=Hypsibius exemplaris TaxID=2072580 RepID=A0A1W0XFF8_HYPEX|nr:hypothetical protein BV898_00218 [Hypsibius exemplaris]
MKRERNGRLQHVILMWQNHNKFHQTPHDLTRTVPVFPSFLPFPLCFVDLILCHQFGYFHTLEHLSPSWSPCPRRRIRPSKR